MDTVELVYLYGGTGSILDDGKGLVGYLGFPSQLPVFGIRRSVGMTAGVGKLAAIICRDALHFSGPTFLGTRADSLLVAWVFRGRKADPGTITNDVGCPGS